MAHEWFRLSALVLAIGAVQVHTQTLGYSFANVTALRKHLLADRYLDSFVPPEPTDDGQGSVVSLQLQVFKIVNIDMTTATMRLKVWRRMRWNDPRLAWNQTDWGGVWELRAEPGVHSGGSHDAIDNNIWTPTIHHYNAATDPEQTLEPGALWIYSDGSVFQSRPGFLDISCRFNGLVMFPYDELSCPFDVGSWDYGDNVINLTFFDDGGVLINTLQETAGTSYQEYTITNTTWKRVTLNYPCCPEPFTNLFMLLYFRRTRTSHYYTGHNYIGHIYIPLHATLFQANQP